MSKSPFVIKLLFVLYALGILFRLNIFFPSEEGFTSESYFRLAELVINSAIIFCIIKKFPWTWKLGIADAVLSLRGIINVLLLHDETKQKMLEAITSKDVGMDAGTANTISNITLGGTMLIVAVSAGVYTYLWLRTRAYFENPNWQPPKKEFDRPADV